MKRPLGMIGFFFFATLTLVTQFSLEWALGLGIFALVTGGLFLLLPRFRKEGVFPTALFTAGAACLMTVAYLGFAVAPAQSLYDGEVETRFFVTSDAKAVGNQFLYTAEATVSEPPLTLRTVLFTDTPLDCEAYEVMQASLQFSLVEDDDRANYFPDGIFTTASLAGELESTGEQRRPLSFYFYRFQKNAVETIQKNLSPSVASIITGVTMGDKDGLSDELIDQIRISGASHMFAVSGMHIAIFGQAMVLLLQALGLRKRRCTLVSLGVIWCFIGICGFPFSSVRSGIMFSIYALGLALRASSDGLNSLGLSLLFMALLNPFCAMDLGLLLSASATLGIILLASPLVHRITRRWPDTPFMRRFARPLVSMGAVSFSATLFTLPLCIVYFGWISTYSILTNLLLFFAPYVILFCTPLALLCSALGLSFLSMPLFLADGLAARWMQICVEWVSLLPYSYLPAGENGIVFALAGCLILVALFLLLSPQSRPFLRLTALSCALLMAVSILSLSFFTPSSPQIYLAKDSGGISALVIDGEHTALIGCGSAYNGSMRSLLRSKRLEQLDVLVLPELSRGYAGGADAILDGTSFETVYAPDCGPNRSVLDGRGEPVVTQPISSRVIPLWEGVSISLNEQEGALFLTLHGTEIVFLLSSQVPNSLLPVDVAISPPDLASTKAKTLLLGGVWEGSGDQDTVIHTADEGGLLLIPKEETILIRRW